MAINKKLITFNSESVFEAKLKNNEILDTSIVFIKDTGKIWTHGVYFGDRHTEYLLNIKDDFNNTPDGFLVRITDNLTNDRYLDFKSPRLWGHTLTPNTGLTGPLLVSSATYATTPNKVGCTEYGLGAISHNTQPAIAFDNGGNTTISKILKVTTYILDSKSVITTTKSLNGTALNAIKQYDERGAFISSFSNPAYLNIQGAQASTTTWQPWVTAAATDLASWGIGLCGTDLYIGRIKKEDSDLTNTWKFLNDGKIEAAGFKTPNGTSSGFLKADGSIDTTNYNESEVYTSTLTGRNLTTDWTVVEDLLAKLGSNAGSYLIQITYSARIYTGVFSYVSDGQNTNEEVILHMAGSDETVGGTKRGRLFAKIGCTSYVGNGGTTQYKLELLLSVDLAESNAQLTIKYKKLI